MTYTEIDQPITIEGVEESTIFNYFTTINQAEFEQTASLFAEEGELHAPFEKPIAGRNAIASYLTKEAAVMQLFPQKGIKEIEGEVERIEVTGKVKTSLFQVNVVWHFQLNPDRQIAIARIKLIASPQELLGLKRFQS
ncbi:nuclear transport factor 2 family protein [Waterburya agarophytonicola K14]|uniref:Nuclear transport factor 2 family protein n=1 Tax=Waterburya agarophytonicola KI4 TaxID=2874699 RepID=A0A964FEV3_9CYAN|nr:nuclear transport factor 2 family protein [Waterburya agarophytonicola]MCC0176291.1 nuclear transport factor 2 family protein [Waterburya agarophytonicola KI4]